MTPPRAAGGPVKRPRPAGSAPRRAAGTTSTPRRPTTPQDRPYHMVKEITHEKGKATITTLCGTVGKPWVFGETPGEIHTTCWPSDVTCPECIAHPGVGKHQAHMDHPAAKEFHDGS